MISPHSNNKEVIKRNNIISNEKYGCYNIHWLWYTQYVIIYYCFILCVIVIMHNQLQGCIRPLHPIYNRGCKTRWVPSLPGHNSFATV